MRRRLLLFILLTSTASIAQFPIHGVPQRIASRNVVSNYCRMDYEGSRLLKDSWARMKPLTTWKDNPDWQGFTVVSQYELVDASDGLRSAIVVVKYFVLGRFEGGLGYAAEPGTEEVTFRLKDVDGDWKIDDVDPIITPHISKARAVAWLKTSLAAEKDAANKIALQKALLALAPQ